MAPITPPGKTRERVYRFMRRRLLAGDPPSVRELQQAMGFSAVQTAQQHLKALVGEGRLLRPEGRARGYRLPERLPETRSQQEAHAASSAAFSGRTFGGRVSNHTFATRSVPLLGRVQAGGLTEAVEDPEGWLTLPSRFDASQLFALRVQGLSMSGAGILPGDIAIVRQQETAESGDVVVAMVDDEATIKRFYRRGRQLELQPENPDFEVIVPTEGSLKLLGKVVELRRYMDGVAPLEEAPPEEE
ncbi:MAG: transcriptional repressor LexA [bacterium]|nr:repressor LexA [Candidatus Binatota bacterium]